VRGGAFACSVAGRKRQDGSTNVKRFGRSLQVLAQLEFRDSPTLPATGECIVDGLVRARGVIEVDGGGSRLLGGQVGNRLCVGKRHIRCIELWGSFRRLSARHAGSRRGRALRQCGAVCSKCSGESERNRRKCSLLCLRSIGS